LLGELDEKVKQLRKKYDGSVVPHTAD
jgi:hypothetical protein